MFPLKRAGEKIWHLISSLAGRRRVRRIIAVVLFFIFLTLIVSVDYVPQRINLQVGQVSPTDIFAPRSIVFEDEAKTREAREQAKEAIAKQYRVDPQVSVGVQEDISSLLAQIGEVQRDQSLQEQEKLERLQAVIEFPLPESVLKDIARSDPETLRQVETEVNSLVAQAMEQGITFENQDQVTEMLVGQVKHLGPGPSYTSLAEGLIRKYLRPNKFFDQEKTELLQRTAMEAVPPVMVSVKEGEKIIGEGEIVTHEHMTKLEAFGLTGPRLPVKSITGTAMLIALLMIVVLFYLYQQNREIYQNAGHLYLLGLIVIVILGVGKAIMAINVTQWPQFGALFAYMVPVAAAGMLIAILLDSRLAVLVVAVMSFLVGVMTGGQIRFAVVGLIGGITGVYGVSKLSQRGDLARAGVYTGAANVLAIFTMGLISDTPIGLVITSSLAMGTINGILSSILTNGALPYLESTFSITSAVRLLEFSHPSNPILRRLLTEAPGTYHHSILVGNLAESAAEEVGGEPLLVRVGAYYHDIGKLKRPYFFIENQMTSENPHDKIAPSLSTLILTSHVKDGVELAREIKLPETVVDVIEQHHGTSLCSYFYHKAMESGGNENISEDDYRYEGPKPQTKEAAIVMLADSVEAAVRSMQNRTPGKVEGVVRKIIKDKLLDGQLDESDLTLKDLDSIANAFVKVLSGIFHSRIEYPDASEMERRKSKRGSRKQSAGKGTGK